MRREWILFVALAAVFGGGVLVGATFFAGEAGIERFDRGRSVSEPVTEREAESVSSNPISNRAATAAEPLTRDTPTPALVGRVETRSGEPVSGLELVWTPVDGGAALETTTDTGGRFSVLADPQSRYSPAAKSSQWTLENVDGQQIESLPFGPEVLLIATRAYSLEVDVVLADGGRPEKIDIQLLRGRQRFRRSWTRDRPTLHLPRGIYSLQAITSSGQRSTSASAIVDGESQDDVTLRFEAADSTLSIAGRLLASGSERWRSVSIELNGQSKPLSASQDRFEFPLTRSGDYELAIRRGSARVLVHPVTVEEHSEYVEIYLPPIDESNSASVTVLDPWGEPLDDFMLSVSVKTERSFSGGHREWELSDNGRRVFLYDPKALEVLQGLVAGTVHLSVDAGVGYGSLEAPAPPPGGHHTFRYRLPALVELKCETGDGVLVDGDRLKVRFDRRGYDIDERGLVTLAPLQPGEYSVGYQMLQADSSQTIAALPRRTVRLESGRQRLSVPLPALYDLRVVFPGLERSTSPIHLSLSSESCSVTVTQPPEAGEISIPYLTPGRYKVNSITFAELDQVVMIPDQRVLIISQ